MPKIDKSLVPKADVDYIARSVLAGATEFYENPENLKAFEEWKAKQEGKTA